MHNLLEPASLLADFMAHPPGGFSPQAVCGMPGFVTRFDLTTTMAPEQRQRLASLPFWKAIHGLMQPRTLFLGSTVTEFMPLAETGTALPRVSDLIAAARDVPFLILKDLPGDSTLVGELSWRRSGELLAACTEAGFLLVAGQALAHVPIDFASEAEYLARFSASRRKDIERKLRSRAGLEIDELRSGDARLSDPALLDEIYRLYRNVYDQSEVHFDLLTAGFFRAVLQDADNGGILFAYRRDGQLIGWNLCFESKGMLIDKYVGFAYPQSREANLYFVSWFHNLAYCLAHGLRHYVAGWTDPEVKRRLGARFCFTQHAVWLRNPLLRRLLRPFRSMFEADRQWHDSIR